MVSISPFGISSMISVLEPLTPYYPIKYDYFQFYKALAISVEYILIIYLMRK